MLKVGMPKTDAEWQALDARIAREVMDLQQACSDGDLCWVTPSFEYRYLVYDPAATTTVDPEYDEWQPHKNVAQALMALDSVVKKGIDANVKTRHYDSQHEVWMVPAECRGPCWLGVDAERAQAICLAIAQWMDAQGAELRMGRAT